MIRATKAVREEISHRVDIELFESLLQPINFQHYCLEASELFVIFESIEEESQAATFFWEDGVGYLTVYLPYQSIVESETPFRILREQFLSQLKCVEGLEKADGLLDACQVCLMEAEGITR